MRNQVFQTWEPPDLCFPEAAAPGNAATSRIAAIDHASNRDQIDQIDQIDGDEAPKSAALGNIAAEGALRDRGHPLQTWHRAQLKAALAGVHRDVIARLLTRLEDLRSIRALVAQVSEQDWSSVAASTRLTALHEINRAIAALCGEGGPISDPLPDAPSNAYRRIIAALFPQP